MLRKRCTLHIITVFFNFKQKACILLYYSNYYKIDKILIMGKKTKKIEKKAEEDKPIAQT